MLLVWQSPGGGGGGDGTQGDKIENPFVVTGLPFSTTGTTVGFTDDYDEEVSTLAQPLRMLFI